MAKRKFLYRVEVEKIDGSKAIFSIYKEGKGTIIRPDKGAECHVHPSSGSVENEILISFNAKVLRTIE